MLSDVYALGVAFDRITVDPAQMSGLPCIRGLRVTVSAVVGQLAAGRSTDFGALLARQEACEPSFLLLRQLNDRKPEEQAGLLLANLETVMEALAAGAVVTLTPRHLRVRPLPIRPSS